MTNAIVSKEACTACATCMNVCAHEAIIMQEDEAGYLYPQIDSALCVDCGLCEKVCPVLHPIKLHHPSGVYAVISRNNWEHKTSASGGAASVLGRYLLKREGIVYGCSQENYKNIKHIRVSSEEGLKELKGSKYVQSDMDLCYRMVKQDLQEGRPVLFIGTPCQVAGLKSYLHRDYEQLYVIDLVCHGVAPQRMLRDDVEAYDVRIAQEDFYVNFRWKAKYGIQYGMQLCQKDEKCRRVLKSVKYPCDAYITAFMTGLSFRENCHQCVYSGIERIGDITVGDFWGLGAFNETKMNSKEGVSLLLVNSEKGRRLFDEVKREFVCEERILKEAVRGNANLRHSSPRPQNKDLFMQAFKEHGLRYACKVSIPRQQYIHLILVEGLKSFPIFVYAYKAIRLWKNQRKNK